MLIKNIKSKGVIFDINIQTIDKLITLEMQRLKPDYDFKNRLLYYLISNYSKTLVKGDKYNTKDTILICFTNFRFNEYTCVETFTMNNTLGTTFCGIKIVILDFTMAKFCDNIELKKWIYLEFGYFAQNSPLKFLHIDHKEIRE